MLIVTIPSLELFDERTSMFVNTEEIELQMEHSLVTLSEWESKWEQPFLKPEPKTTEQTYSYLQIMVRNRNVSIEEIKRLPDSEIEKINDYIESKMTATWFNEMASSRPASREMVTNELIYHWMVALNVPWEAEHWHLNRLITLLRVIDAKNQKPKKMPRNEQLARQRELNAQRKAKLGTNG